MSGAHLEDDRPVGEAEGCSLCAGIQVVTFTTIVRRSEPFCTACGRRFAMVTVSTRSPGVRRGEEQQQVNPSRKETP